MIGRRIRAFLGEIALYHSANGDPEKALWYVEKMKRIGDIKPFQRAYEGTLLLVRHRFSEAEKILNEVILETSSKNNHDDQYTCLYCLSLISNIKGNTAGMNKAIASAKGIPCRPIVRRYIPLVLMTPMPPDKSFLKEVN